MSVAHSFESSSISHRGSILARYSLPGEERKLVAYSNGGTIALYDCPVSGSGDRYLIDRGIFWPDALEGLVGEYVGHAERIGCAPASREGIGAAVDPLEFGEAGVFLRFMGGGS
jgi:hypothetical protein